ncbi:SSI family serine proteinase inhibitor [Streptomyces roseoverticillatus]|uniref:SSI family serine proteinase inhibitor n=1 Tax=Streptomyces roseoverticillatus TaxID=66429 RepID=A0ABV3IP36_9ACTN
MLLRRIALAVAALAPAALLAVPSASAAPAAPAAGLPMPPANPEGFDHLTVTISGNGRFDGSETSTYLYCHPDGGTHPRAREACHQIDGQTTWGKDPFAPVPDGTVCTMIYGGPQRARVTGHWAGRPVRADFKRTNGCEIERWEKFSRLLGTPEKGWPGIR